MKKKAIHGVYVVFLIWCMVLVGLFRPCWGANNAELNLVNAARKVISRRSSPLLRLAWM